MPMPCTAYGHTGQPYGLRLCQEVKVMAEQSVVVKVLVNGESVQAFPLNPKTFSSGSIGYFGQGKTVTDTGEKYQCQFQLVLIGSKPQVPQAEEPVQTATTLARKAAVTGKVNMAQQRAMNAKGRGK
jgi:hypothetical protein